MFFIKSSDASGKDAEQLLGELNTALLAITGNSGAGSFCEADSTGPRGAFLIGYLDGKPITCGALRLLSGQTAEIKRVYARKNSIGAAHKMIQALEEKALQNGFDTILLETRTVNRNAVHFYLSCGYTPCSNYGKYVGRTDAVCFSKKL